jgi:2-polyprenyl-6-methoxyphenol hydroxylase-like FAD-dependent oxidoreductase
MTDVLICGAGAAGLTLALDLARRGVSFLLIDKAAQPFAGARGKGIQPRTQEVFEDLGVLDRLAAAGGPYPPQRVYGADGSHVDSPVTDARPAAPDTPYTQGLMVAQFRTEAVLRARLLELGHAPRYGVELRALRQDAEGVTATLATADGEVALTTRYLVGTDGGRSTVRKLLGIDFPGKTLGVRALVADVVVEGLDRGVWHRFNEGAMERQLGLCPLMGTNMFQVQAPIPAEGEPDLSAAGLDAFVRARSGRGDIRVVSVSWASAYAMNARLAQRYRVGRVFLAGDAAHIHPPTGGQGLNTSVQDAYNLGWKLDAVLAGADDQLLDSYEAERRPVAEAMLGLSTRLLAAARHGDNRRGRETDQLDIGYPASPLSLDRSAGADGLAAGERAPDAPLHGAAGQPLRLFSLLHGGHWTLLGFEVDADAVYALGRPGLRTHALGTGGDLQDPGGQFQRIYGTQPGELVLVRPDGYIGAIVAADGAAALEAYLARAGRARQ